MPKDNKKSKDGKKKEGTSQEVEVVVKRKSSIVDSSGGSSSSSSSSDNSGTSSENGSLAGDSDGSVGGFVSDNEKGTMTNDSQEGTSQSVACSSTNYVVGMRDRTEEMRRIMSQREMPVRFVTDEQSVPVTDNTHFVPIPSEDGPSTYASKEEQQTSSAKHKPANKGNGKQKQLTKKERKAMERKENGDVQYPGQKSKAPLQVVCGGNENLQVHHFDESAGGSDMFLGTNRDVAIPFLRGEEELGHEMRFTDLHRHSQVRYLRYVTGLGDYISLPASVKLLHRMGFGIAGSGMSDDEPVLPLSMSGAKNIMKHKYSEYVADGAKIVNWRAEFESQADMDRGARAEEYKIIQDTFSNFLESYIESIGDEWMKQTLRTVLHKDLRDILLRFGEVERYIARKEAKSSRRVKELDNIPLAQRTRPQRIGFIVSSLLQWGTKYFNERFEDNTIEKRACSILMHLASTALNEKPCHEDRHRKCTVLHFFLSQCESNPELKSQFLSHRFSGGQTLLHFAAMTGSPCQVDVLLRQGAALNELNDYFKSPVALALRRHQSLIARQLMWHGADIGGALNLNHIFPRSTRQSLNKDWSDYEDHCAMAIPYKAREFINARVKSLNLTMVSWVEALLIEADPRLNLGVDSCKSALHQVRIGGDVMDPLVTAMDRGVLKNRFEKTLRMSIERAEGKGPVVLFLIPCQYTRFDTTMGPHTPHIVRTSMLTDTHRIAAIIADKEKQRMASSEERNDYTSDIKNCRPVRVLTTPISISYADSCMERVDVLEPFFSWEHNGLIYGYILPNSVTHTLPDSPNRQITLNINVSETASHRFKDSFFMVQAIQLKIREQVEPLFKYPVNPNHQDERSEAIAAEVAKRKAAKMAEQAAEVNRKERAGREKEERYNSMVADVHRGVALNKIKREEMETAVAVMEAETAARSAAVASASVTPQANAPNNKRGKTKTE
ncbi:hypothetical protein L3Y34_006111 [Caenorhabditis briggsae]|uniref:Uncharacterized protein n=1 Tax=Caenorhabditis briggsae TaxID=6238 RepID=A0AAE8ZW53_CAEBR|nr:hypothetical protein L3Y34_006111 [Caenorhabditis briggsae]